MSKKAWLIFAAVCIVLLGGLVYISAKDRIDVSTIDTNKVQAANAASGDIADHVYGKGDSKVVLVEYGDYQCPGCGNAYPKVKAVAEKYKGQLAFVFRNFPITSIHPNARVAAAVAEAAGVQGKFWEMHDKLYETQSSWQSLGASERLSFFTNYAKQLSLNTDTFNSDLESKKINQKVSYDQALGKKAKVSATPTFFLNGKPVTEDTWSDEAKLEKMIIAELKGQGIPLPEATATP